MSTRLRNSGYQFGKHKFSVSASTLVDSRDTGANEDREATGIAYVYSVTKMVDLNVANLATGFNTDGVDDPSATIVGGRVKF